MAKNEIFPPNGPDNKMSLPVTGDVKSGDPVKVGAIVGVAQTDKQSVDGGDNGVINSNAPGNVTVWNEGVWRLPVTVSGGSAGIGDVVYAKTIANSSKVDLQNAAGTGNFPFGVLYEAVASNGVKELGVRVFRYAGPVTE